jgi:hypothetical protein
VVLPPLPLTERVKVVVAAKAPVETGTPDCMGPSPLTDPVPFANTAVSVVDPPRLTKICAGRKLEMVGGADGGAVLVPPPPPPHERKAIAKPDRTRFDIVRQQDEWFMGLLCRPWSRVDHPLVQLDSQNSVFIEKKYSIHLSINFFSTSNESTPFFTMVNKHSLPSAHHGGCKSGVKMADGPKRSLV